MAITAIEYSLFRKLRASGLLPLGGDVLEIGEANWYGDVGLNELKADIPRHAVEAEREPLAQRVDELYRDRPDDLKFQLAKIAWRTFLQPGSLTAIDMDGTPEALRFDLNGPIDLGRQFDVVMNLGTLEHVFNVAQAMQTIHRHTRPGGLMIHGMPLTGWLDHGFYTFQPTFYWDVAAANGYAVELAVCAQLDPLKLTVLRDRDSVGRLAQKGELGANSLIYMVLRQAADAAPFRIPLQGYYARTLSDEGVRHWKKKG